MTHTLVASLISNWSTEFGLYIFILAGFLGYHLISRVPPLLHTPLMSATNALSGISLIGSIVVAGRWEGFAGGWGNFLSTFLGFIAVACSSTNVVGGFLITDRLLAMFKRAEETRAWWMRSGWPILVAGLGGIGLILLILWAAGILRDADEALIWIYLGAGAMFILALKGLSSPRYARQGMFLAEIGMIVAIVGTLFEPEIKGWGYLPIFVGLVIGSVVGGIIGLRVPMTAVPQRTALSHSLGALAAMLIGIAEYVVPPAGQHPPMIPLGFEVLIGGLTFTGSLMAAGKLQGLLPERPMTYPGQRVGNFVLLAVVVLSFFGLIANPSLGVLFALMVILALAFGVLLVMPIGAADMPVVIALLNSYAGLADAAMGFVLANRVQIITGSLDGTSGFLLSLLMCRAMNRSAWNVLFGAFGKIEEEPGGDRPADDTRGTIRSITTEEVPVLFEGARSVIIVPGYGMAVAQAQHGVAALAALLLKRGIDVKYAIHPVAGRMPGHMNVLLAEANVPYDQLHDMEEINPYFPEADVALVVGANDVTNPAARSNKSSPLYGMPILEVDRA